MLSWFIRPRFWAIATTLAASSVELMGLLPAVPISAPDCDIQVRPLSSL